MNKKLFAIHLDSKPKNEFDNKKRAKTRIVYIRNVCYHTHNYMKMFFFQLVT